MSKFKWVAVALVVAVWTPLAAVVGFAIELPAMLQELRLLVPSIALAPVLFFLGRSRSGLWVVAFSYAVVVFEYLLVYNYLDKASGINEFSAGGLLAVLLYSLVLAGLNLIPCAVVFVAARATRRRIKSE